MKGTEPAVKVGFARALTEREVKLLVAVVEYVLIYPVVRRPATASSDPGVVVPTPTFPDEVTTRAVPDAVRDPPVCVEVVATTKMGRVVDALEEVA